MRWEVVADITSFQQNDTVRFLHDVGPVKAGRKGVVAAIERDVITVFVPERLGSGGNEIHALEVQAQDIELTDRQEPWHELLA